MQEVSQAVNQVRCSPSQFLTKMNSILEEFSCGIDLVRTRSNGTRVRTMEGVASVLEAIRFLKTAAPRKPLELNVDLCEAAHLHLQDLQKRFPAQASHMGLDLSTPGDRIRRFVNWQGSIGENIAVGEYEPHEIVAQLIIDDGVDSRAHRHVLMDQSFRHFGVALSSEKPYYCVMTFAEHLNS